MFHIVFNADENYIPYCAVLITSIIQATKTENPPPPRRIPT
ncbi:hypothetical protein [Helicobacter rodentium]|nr:hypothetical protein [Helicobacter rodentium]